MSSSEKFNGALLPLLPKNRFNPIIVFNDAQSARRSIFEDAPDIVIINAPLPDEFGVGFATDVSENDGISVLLFTRAEHFAEISSKLTPYGILTLSRPTTPLLIVQTLELMCGTRERLRRMQLKNTSVREKLDDIRIVNKAKWLLIEQLKMTESEAHRYIEKQAMDRCVTKRAVAENILSTYK